MFAFYDTPPNGSPIHPKPVAPPRPDDFELDKAAPITLDKWCAASDVEIGEDGLSATIGTGTVLATRGWDEGKHYWEFKATHCGWFSFCGVSSKYPCDEIEIRRGYSLAGIEGGFSFAGAGTEHNLPPTSSAFHAEMETPEKFEMFHDGDTVGLLLDCDVGSLAYFKNGKYMGEAFTGFLRCTEFVPAWGGSGLISKFEDIKFDLPIPEKK